MDWLTGADPYLSLLHGAETTFSLPTNLLVRVAFQECSWRAEVINCTIKSRVGAVGMFQLMPEYFPNAGLSVAADASTAAQLLANLYACFHDWQLAVASYDWGEGNVHHELVTDGGTPRLDHMPLETQRYVQQVFADVPIPGVLV